MKRIFRRKTKKTKATNLKADINNLGAGVVYEEAVGENDDGANGSGMSVEQYDEGSKEIN
ncbi:MAG: hypothetical protein KGD66_09105 [Candidatus Lokiarchaeota archaeon]|nr:hypothetical protein [Candidatus Lokiarchaeota archaeon]